MKFVKGNLDPCALYAPAEQLEVMVKDMVTKFGKRRKPHLYTLYIVPM